MYYKKRQTTQMWSLAFFYVYNSQISYINVGKHTKDTDILQNLTQKFVYMKNK